MTKRSVLAVVAVGCACAGAAVVAARGATGPAQVRITDTETSRSLAPPASGAVAGTIEVIAQRLYNLRITERAFGRSQLVCTYVDRKNRTCVSTYILPRGTIVAIGAVQNRLLYDLPIVGGTGLYDNARGTLTVTATHLRPRREVLLFRLLG